MTLTSLPDIPQPRVDNQWIELMRPAAELAAQLAQTEFVPAEFRNRPEAIAACILFGVELGIGPMQSLAKIDVVKGRPTPKAELGRALAVWAGHELWVEEQTNTRVTVNGKRRNSSHIFTVTWTMDDARRAGIAGNPAYAKYPRQMLFARASAELVRQMAPDVLGGIVMFAEEAIDADPDTISPTPTTIAPAAVAPTQTRKRPARTKPAATPKNEPESPTDEPDDDRPSDAQTRMAMALFADIGITDRTDRLAATTALIGHPVDSWNDLNRSEAGTIIDSLERVKSGGISFDTGPNGDWITVIQPTLEDDLLEDDDHIHLGKED